MAGGMLFELDASHHAVVHLLVLGTILVFSIARTLLLYSKVPQFFLPSCACHLADKSSDLYSKGSCARITTLGLLPASRV